MTDTPRAGVFLGYLHPNEMPASFVDSLDALKLYDSTALQQGRPQLLRRFGKVRAGYMGIVEGRNQIAEEALKSECEWLFFVDADMGFSPDIVERLVRAADPDTRPIVGALAFAYKEFSLDGYNGFRLYPLPTLYDYVRQPDGKPRFTGRHHFPANHLVRVAATGCAALLIHWTVLDRLHTEYGPHWFNRIMGADGLMGEDISFCARVGAQEIPIHVHTGIETTHYKSLWVGSPDFWHSYVAPAASERVDVTVPTVAARVDKLERLASTLQASTGLADLWLVVDDESHAQAAKQAAPWAHIIVEPGTVAHKINVAWQTIRVESAAPWMKVVGDDVKFHPGWLDHAQQVARLYEAKVVGSNDLANERVIRGEHATHWMMARDWIEDEGASWDGPGTIAHEGYAHNFVDDEIVKKAQMAGVFQLARGCIVEHMHPMVGKGQPDDVYRIAGESFDADAALFAARYAEAAGAVLT